MKVGDTHSSIKMKLLEYVTETDNTDCEDFVRVKSGITGVFLTEKM